MFHINLSKWFWSVEVILWYFVTARKLNHKRCFRCDCKFAFNRYFFIFIIGSELQSRRQFILCADSLWLQLRTHLSSISCNQVSFKEQTLTTLLCQLILSSESFSNSCFSFIQNRSPYCQRRISSSSFSSCQEWFWVWFFSHQRGVFCFRPTYFTFIQVKSILDQCLNAAPSTRPRHWSQSHWFTMATRAAYFSPMEAEIIMEDLWERPTQEKRQHRHSY